jgi:hypothetical protein
VTQPTSLRSRVPNPAVLQFPLSKPKSYAKKLLTISHSGVPSCAPSPTGAGAFDATALFAMSQLPVKRVSTVHCDLAINKAVSSAHHGHGATMPNKHNVATHLSDKLWRSHK